MNINIFVSSKYFYLHHLEEVSLLEEPLVQFILLCSELCGVGVGPAQMLQWILYGWVENSVKKC